MSNNWYNVSTSNKYIALAFVVGAGAGGSVAANRLSEDPNDSVLLLEAGGIPSSFERIPYLAAQLPQTRYDWGYTTVPQENACYGLKDRVRIIH